MRRGIVRALSVTFLVGGVCASGTVITPIGAAYAATGASSVSSYTGRAAGTSAAGRLCESETHPRTARRLSGALHSALKGRQGAESVAVYARKRDLTCTVAPARRYDSASVIKVSILAALLRKSMERGRWPSAKQRELAHKMITKSDNDAASALWRSVGRPGMRRFLKLAPPWGLDATGGSARSPRATSFGCCAS
jgi:beta-lactamase class A